MPNQPKTPLRAFRIPDETYMVARRRAELQGKTISDVVRELLDAYASSVAEDVRRHSCQHKAYRMTCAEFEALRDQSDGACQICGCALERTVIDHDHRIGLAAVRGLVCYSCNRILARVDSGAVETVPPEVARYLADAWHLRKAMAS